MIQQLMAMLESLSPLRVLQRGYSIVRDSSGVVRSATQAQPGQQLEITFYEGQRKVKVLE